MRNGSYFRKSDSKTILRWKCVGCRRSFSQATATACFGQNKRRVNEPLRILLCSGVSLRRAARILRVHRITVARKLMFLAQQARLTHRLFLEGLRNGVIGEVQFDEMETLEHSKLKPLSIPLLVTRGRKILAFEVASMPAKGLLAAASVEKYGWRRDERKGAMRSLLETVKGVVSESALFKSDENPHYPRLLKTVFPQAEHETTKGRRGCIVGQGELKKIPWDPLFSLNHTAAMLRANVNRLFRRTWCTTKRPDRLKDHLALYVNYHNHVLT